MKPGPWKLVGRELCLTHKSRKETTTGYCEIWLRKDWGEYRRDDVTVTETWLHPPLWWEVVNQIYSDWNAAPSKIKTPKINFLHFLGHLFNRQTGKND